MNLTISVRGLRTYPLRKVRITYERDHAYEFALDCGHHIILTEIRGRMPLRLRCALCYSLGHANGIARLG